LGECGSGLGIRVGIRTGQGQGQPCHTPKTEGQGWDGNRDSPTYR